MEIILIVYLVVSIALIGIILLQQGKGAEMGASFGAGGANTVFGASGSGNVLTKSTTILAILFFAIALAISYMNSESTVATDDVIDVVPAEQEKAKTSLESELPKSEGGLESEVAPAAKSTSEAKAKTDDLIEAAKTKTEEVKAKAEEKVEAAKEKAEETAEKKKDDTEN